MQANEVSKSKNDSLPTTHVFGVIILLSAIYFMGAPLAVAAGVTILLIEAGTSGALAKAFNAGLYAFCISVGILAPVAAIAYLVRASLPAAALA